MSLIKVPTLKTITIQNFGNVPLEVEFSKTFAKPQEKCHMQGNSREKKQTREKFKKNLQIELIKINP